jgi:diguanylate cyclase (GGDEF)-like protein
MSATRLGRARLGSFGRAPAVRYLLAAAVLLALAAAMGVLYQRSYPDVFEQHRGFNATLADLRHANAQWSVQILKAQTGVVSNYDALNAAEQAVRRLSAAAVAGMAPFGLIAQETGVLQLEKAMGAKSEAAERIKSERAVLVNSLRFLPLLLTELEQDMSDLPPRHPATGPAREALVQLSSRLLRLTSFPEGANAERVSEAVQALHRETAQLPAGDAMRARLDLVEVHADICVKNYRVTQAAVLHALAVSVEAAIDTMEARVAARVRDRLAESERYRGYLFGLAVILCALGAYAGYGWQRSFQALRGANGSLAEQLEQTRLLMDKTAKLTDVATRDALTGLVNRGLLIDRLQNVIFRAQRNGGSLAVVFIDLDGFKAVNDRCGHETGDKLLVAVAAQLARNVRESDTAARLGGDEFVLVLDDSAESGARRVAQAVLADIESVRTAGKYAVSISASLGICVWSCAEPTIGAAQPIAASMTAQELLDRADRAMYQAKREGKGRCCVARESRDSAASSGAPGLMTA